VVAASAGFSSFFLPQPAREKVNPKQAIESKNFLFIRFLAHIFHQTVAQKIGNTAFLSEEKSKISS
jgi:hypothetical protein